MLEKNDFRKIGDVETADLKSGKEFVFRHGRTEAGGNVSVTDSDDGDYNVPDGKDDFGAIQAASRAMPDRYVQEYHAGKGIDEGLRKRISRVFELAIDASAGGRGYHKQSLLNPKTNTKAVICEDVDNKVFHDVFETARNFLKTASLLIFMNLKPLTVTLATTIANASFQKTGCPNSR